MIIGIFIGILIWSILGTLAFIISKEDEEISTIFSIGVVGWTLMLVFKIIRLIKKKVKYYNCKSIFEHVETHEKYYCNIKDTNDINWLKTYRLHRRYAKKSEWSQYSPINEATIAKSKMNCEHCKYDNECKYEDIDTIKCKNERGIITEFDKFEKN